MSRNGELRRIAVAIPIRDAAVRDRIDRVVRALPGVVLGPARESEVVFVDASEDPAGWAGHRTVVALFGRPDGDLVEAAARAGVRGLILVDDLAEDVHRAIHDVAAGRAWISPRLAKQLLATVASVDPETVPRSLTARERQALSLLAQGKGNADIAATMFVSVSAVKYHVSNILRKFGCRDRGQLIAQLNRPNKLVAGLGRRR